MNCCGFGILITIFIKSSSLLCFSPSTRIDTRQIILFSVIKWSVVHQHYHLSYFTSQSYISLRWLKYVLLILYDKLYASVCLLILFQWSIGNPPLIYECENDELEQIQKWNKSNITIYWLWILSRQAWFAFLEIHFSWIRNDSSQPVLVIIIFSQFSMMPVSNSLLLNSPFHPQQTVIAQPCNIFFLFYYEIFRQW